MLKLSTLYYLVQFVWKLKGFVDLWPITSGTFQKWNNNAAYGCSGISPFFRICNGYEWYTAGCKITCPNYTPLYRGRRSINRTAVGDQLTNQIAGLTHLVLVWNIFNFYEMSISFYFYENQSIFFNDIEKLKSDFIKKFL